MRRVPPPGETGGNRTTGPASTAATRVWASLAKELRRAAERATTSTMATTTIEPPAKYNFLLRWLMVLPAARFGFEPLFDEISAWQAPRQECVNHRHNAESG